MNRSHQHLYEHLISLLDDIMRHEIYTINKCVLFDIDGALFRDTVYKPTKDIDMFHSTINFLKYCNIMSIPVFIITARPRYKENVRMTKQILHDLGLDYDDIYFCPRGHNTFVCKQEYRNIIRRNHYNIVIAIGDNIWDLDKHTIPHNYLVKLHDDGNCSYSINP